MVAAMTAKKRGPAAKGVVLPKHKAKASAFDKLPENPTEKQLENAAVSVALADLEQRVADVRDSWETDSLFEDVIDELSGESEASTPGKFSCGGFTLPISLALLSPLRRYFVLYPICFSGCLPA
jgi:hypothetical protein